MTKVMTEKDYNKQQQLANAAAPTRAFILDSLKGNELKKTTENLVESAMTMGLTDSDDIIRWLGTNAIDGRHVIAAMNRIKERWVNETDDVYSYAKEQRTVQIKKAWEEVRNCEDMYQNSKSTGDKVRVKKLQLEWMQYISKLSFVEKLVEASTPDMQIVVQGSANFLEDKDGN